MNNPAASSGVSNHSQQRELNTPRGGKFDPQRLNSYSFWLDDFGARDANFSVLQNNQFNFIKLDRFLLRDFMKKYDGEGLMRALLRFFYLNHYQVITEWIEIPEQKTWLDDMPCK